MSYTGTATPSLVVPKRPKVITAGKLAVLSAFERPGGDIALLAANGRIYRQTEGSIEALVPMMQEQVCRDFNVDAEDLVLLRAWDRSCMPPYWALWELHTRVFSTTTREVMALAGKKADGDWVFAIPIQKATSGDVEIDDDDKGGAAEALREAGASCTGIVHCHPGSWVGFSGTDRVLFRECPGIHPILAQNGEKLQVHVAIGGAIFSEPEYTLTLEDKVTPEGRAVQIVHSQGLPLDKLLLEPKRYYSTGTNMGFTGSGSSGSGYQHPWHSKGDNNLWGNRPGGWGSGRGSSPRYGGPAADDDEMAWGDAAYYSAREDRWKAFDAEIDKAATPDPKRVSPEQAARQIEAAKISKSTGRRRLSKQEKKRRAGWAPQIRADELAITWDVALQEYVVVDLMLADTEQVVGMNYFMSGKLSDYLEKHTKNRVREPIKGP